MWLQSPGCTQTDRGPLTTTRSQYRELREGSQCSVLRNSKMYCKEEEANFAKGRKRDSERSRGKPRRWKVRETKGKYGFKK